MRPTCRWRELGWMAATVVIAVTTARATAARAADGCGAGDAALLISPRTPIVGAPVRVLAASDAGTLDALAVTDERGETVLTVTRRLGGPPWSIAATLDHLAPGAHRIEALRDGAVVGCVRFTVAALSARQRGGGDETSGARLAGWDRASEALYSAWIEHLFDAPPEATLAFDSLQEVLREPGRNLLHDHLGLGEDDDPGVLGAPPDCADLPYVLRAYFAWKTGLPVGFRHCNRGSTTAPPRCDGLTTLSARDAADPRGWYARASRVLLDGVHSGNARTALDDDATDFYPVALTRAALRPGTIYADPYGHTLMIVKWVPQTAMRGGMLLAVDAQPDNSVARKRFWEGTFLFAADVASAGPGFKAFRPLVRTGRGGVAPLSNEELRDDPRFATYAAEQASLAPDALYARLAALINPDGLRPLQAYRETLDALVEQLETRVDSIQRGEDWVRAHPGEKIAMPAGAAIFETIGPWEDYATPSRDLRLQIAMNVLLDIPDRIVRHPDLFVLEGLPPDSARAAVKQEHEHATQERSITYVRSDGSPWRLTVADVLARRPALEMGYNPNDCIEIRWGAAPGSEEYATCRRRAPVEQHARMETYRDWFAKARRPLR